MWTCPAARGGPRVPGALNVHSAHADHLTAMDAGGLAMKRCKWKIHLSAGECVCTRMCGETLKEDLQN